MRRVRSKPAGDNICGVPGIDLIAPLFVVHCLGGQQGDKSHTSVRTQRFLLYWPPLLEYTFRHNPLLALCGDYWLNGMVGISLHLRWDLTLEWHVVHFHWVKENVGCVYSGSTLRWYFLEGSTRGLWVTANFRLKIALINRDLRG